MKVNYLDQLRARERQWVSSIGVMADEMKVHAFLVGGVVRDLMLGLSVKDVDIVIEGDAIRLAQEWAKKHKARCVPHTRFGTATVYLPDGAVLDFVMARSEVYVKPGALPTVKPGTLKDDLFRRDFTINAMAISLNDKTWGQLNDPYGGFQDIRTKKIRILHAKSFVDDPTRMFRAVRFEQRLGFAIERTTVEFLEKAIASDAVDTVTSERIFSELKKNFQEAVHSGHLKRLYELKLLSASGFQTEWTEDLDGRVVHIERSLKWCRRYVGKTSSPKRWVLIVLLLMQSESETAAYALLKDMGAGRDILKYVRECADADSVLQKLDAQGLHPSQVCALLDEKSLPSLIFLRAIAVSERSRRKVSRYIKEWREQSIPVAGEDLSRAGIPEGPLMRKCLNEVRALYMDGRVSTRAEILKRIRLFKNSIT